MRVMSAGDGSTYLPRTVAAGDGDRSLSTPLTRYHTVEGTPWERKSCCIVPRSVCSRPISLIANWRSGR
jgi:hypothetical protein